MRVVRRGFSEKPRLAKRAVNLVGGDMEEAEVGVSEVGGRSFGRTRSICPIFSRWHSGLRNSEIPIFPSCLKQHIGSENVGLNKLAGAVDGAVDMGLRGQMHDPIGLEISKGRPHGGCVADVGLKELVVRIALEIRQRAGITRVGELVDVEDLMTLGDEEVDEIGADKAGSSSDEDFHAWVNKALL